MQLKLRIFLSACLTIAAAPVSGGNSIGVIDLADPFQPRLALEGEAATDAAGRDVAAIGDFNGDGFGDVLVGAFRHDASGNSDAGAAYVVFGDSGGIPATVALGDLDGSNGFQFLGRASTDNAGEFVAAAGDLNDDGYDDVAIGAVNADPPGLSGAGEVYVLFGGPGPFPADFATGSLDGQNGFAVLGDDSFHELGTSIAGGADLNGDGIDDLVIGAPGFDDFGETDRGAVFVIFGSNQPFPAAVAVAALNGSDGFRIEGPAAGSRAGRSVGLLEDFDGDGLADLAVGVPENDNASGSLAQTGSAYLVFGRASPVPAVLSLETLPAADGIRIDGLEASDEVGRQLASIGDLNDDGLSDLAIGSLEHDRPGLANAGVVYVVFGQAAIMGPAFDLAALDGNNGFELQGAESTGRLGRSLDSAGDFNADGIDDLVASADLVDSAGRIDAGEVYVIFGSVEPMPAALSADTLDGTLGVRIQGATAGERAGFSVAGGADFDNDGFADLVIGAPEADIGAVSRAGQAYVVQGRPFDLVFADGFENGARAPD